MVVIQSSTDKCRRRYIMESSMVEFGVAHRIRSCHEVTFDTRIARPKEHFHAQLPHCLDPRRRYWA